MLRLIFFLILVFFSSKEVFADCKNVFSYPIQIEKIHTIEKTLSSPSLLRGDFKQIKKILTIKKTFTSSGIFVFDQKKGLYWQTEVPFFNILIFTPNAFAQKNKNEIKILPSEKVPFFKEFSNLFQSILSNDYKKLSKNFNLFFIENNQKWFLGLKPKDNNVRNLYQKACLTGSVYIQKVSFEEWHGDTTELYFFKTNSHPNVLTDEERTYFDF